MTAAVDVSSRRWLVAVHEAAHASVARGFDWRVHRTAILDGGGGGTWDDAPWLRARRAAARESVLISLAGPLSEERLAAVTVDPAGRYGQRSTAKADLRRAGVAAGCEWDMLDAHRGAARLGVELPALVVEARRLVAARWGEIERVARVLYERGALNAGEIRSAARR